MGERDAKTEGKREEEEEEVRFSGWAIKRRWQPSNQGD
jgi:hypothetical protein